MWGLFIKNVDGTMYLLSKHERLAHARAEWERCTDSFGGCLALSINEVPVDS